MPDRDYKAALAAANAAHLADYAKWLARWAEAEEARLKAEQLLADLLTGVEPPF